MSTLERFVNFRTSTFMLALALLMGVGISSVWGIMRFSRSAALVEHSYEVLAKNEEIEASVLSAESAARAYRLTESAAQYAEYLAAAPRVTTHTDELLRMVADSPQRTALAVEMRRHSLARLAELQHLVEVQATQGVERARELTRAGRGVELMRAVNDAHDLLEKAERDVLAQREADTDRQAQLLVTFVVIGTLLPVGLLAMLLAGLSRENRRVRELEGHARAAMEQLEAAAVTRDRLSEQRRKLGSYGSLLQSCHTPEEAMQLTAAIAQDLLPEAGGRCYVMRSSQNFAETGARFGTPASDSSELLQPDDCWALRRGQVHRTGPGYSTLRCAHVEAGPAAGDWTLCVPMTAQGATLGLLHLSGRAADSVEAGDIEAATAVSEQLSQTVANLRLRESLRVQSLRDPLTGLYNRRYLEENLYRELQRCERRNLPLSVMMLDVDHFKRFNDEHGHAAGDALLTRVGEVLATLTRGEDIACRYGGEEFTIVLPEAPLHVALRRAEEIRAAIASTSIIHLRQALGPVTVSIGVSIFPADGASPERLLQVADNALYRAKAAGRNRVVTPEHLPDVAVAAMAEA